MRLIVAAAPTAHTLPGFAIGQQGILSVKEDNSKNPELSNKSHLKIN